MKLFIIILSAILVAEYIKIKTPSVLTWYKTKIIMWKKKRAIKKSLKQ